MAIGVEEPSQASFASPAGTLPDRELPSPDPPRPNRRLSRQLAASLGDAGSFSVMVGMGETYLPAFALAAGLGELAAGLVATVPLVAGAILQLVSPWAVRRLGSHRRWVVACAVVQALSFAPLAAAGFLGRVGIGLVFASAAVYWGAGLACGPAWNTWVGTVVPGRIRAGFFARRTRIGQAGLLAGFVAGGLVLEVFRGSGGLLHAFAALFLVAGACRALSAYFLYLQSEPVPPSSDHRRVPMVELAGQLRKGADGSLLAYLLAVQAAAQVAGPYFTPYLLEQLEFSYTRFALLIGSSFAVKVLALPALGRVAHRIGARRLLYFGGVGIIPASGLWLVSQSFAYLLAVQIVAGVAWAAYELAMFLLFFENIREDERTSVLTTYNLGYALATVGGSLVGGAVLLVAGEHPETYLAIFALSAVARLATVGLLVNVRSTGRHSRVLAPARLRRNHRSASLYPSADIGIDPDPELVGADSGRRL